MSWDPDKQECRSYWGYGGDFHAYEEHAKAKAAGYPQTDEYKQFCNRCPISQRCWQELQVRVKEERPKAAADWEALVERHKVDGVDTGQIAAMLLKAGRPDPWTRDLLDNFKMGMEAQGARD